MDGGKIVFMFQDIFIDTSLKNILHKVLHKRQTSRRIQKMIFPIIGISLPLLIIFLALFQITNYLYIKWNQPINYQSPKQCRYRILLLNGRNHWSIQSKDSLIKMNMSLILPNALQIWISTMRLEALIVWTRGAATGGFEAQNPLQGLGSWDE